jgi:hypothetical protein
MGPFLCAYSPRIIAIFKEKNRKHMGPFLCAYSPATDFIWHMCFLFFSLNIAMTWSCRCLVCSFVYGYVLKKLW